MDKKQLEHLNCTKAEIRFLTKEIEEWPEGIVTDYYYDYPNGQKRVRPLIGVADCIGIKRRLDEVLADLNREVQQMEDFLADIDDTELRAILRLKYRNGLTHEQIGNELGYERSVITRKINDFWRSNTQNT